jgi:hypothetical protein
MRFLRYAGMGREASGNAHSDYYRKKAREAVELSEACMNPLMRVSWLELAERWMKRAPAEMQADEMYRLEAQEPNSEHAASRQRDS